MGRGTSANNSDESALKVNNSTVYTVTQTENNTSNVKAYANTVTFTDTFATADKLQISSSSDGTDTTSYTYYADGQLHTVSGTNYSASYTYNSRGNLTERTVNNVTTDYTYSGDRLTAVGNTALTYDSIGNVLTFGNKQYAWSSGRNLASITDGANTYSYAYNKYGYRTSKTVGGTTTYFNVAEDGTIVSQSDGTNTLFFEYTQDGTPLGFVLNDTQYLYITNNSGDVMAVADSTGNIITTYSYNEWGVPTVSAAGEQNIALANLNPIRYRGYYYDSETGYYYLQSRYYDPEICRFINADLPDYAKEQKNETAGINLFVYCCNDAVNGSDPSGHDMFAVIGDTNVIGDVNYISSNKYNCYSFALYKYNRHYNPGYFARKPLPSPITISAIRRLVIEDCFRLHYKVKDVTNSGGANYKLPKNTWLIAIRVCGKDYHFMRKDNQNNIWRFKAGKGGAVLRLTNNLNPSKLKKDWNTYIWTKNHKQMKLNKRNYYTSSIIYLAITK